MSKYVISSSPHLRDNVSTTSIMRDVCIALLPAAVAGVLFSAIVRRSSSHCLSRLRF